MKKIIFLDFDGVLNTEYNQNLLMYHGKSWKDKYGAFFDLETVAELKRIVEETNADFVIESSWKYLGLEAMQQDRMATEISPTPHLYCCSNSKIQKDSKPHS